MITKDTYIMTWNSGTYLDTEKVKADQNAIMHK